MWFQGVGREQKFSVSDLFAQVLPLKLSFYIMANSLCTLNLTDTTSTGPIAMATCNLEKITVVTYNPHDLLKK